jgi:hypothetical protein
MQNTRFIIINFIKHSFSFLLDFIFFMMAHILFNFLLGSYLKATLLSLFFYSIYLLLIRKNLTLILPIFMAFFIFTFTVPIMNDRSGTVFLMKVIDQASGISKSQISDKLNNEYFKGDFFLEKRINEEIRAGNILEINSKYFVTKKGNLFVNFYNIMDKVYSK